MDKNVIISILFGYYGKLLTDKQAEAIDLYYEEDLSLTEIAKIQGVSKQNVSDTIKRSEKALFEYEDKLNLVEKIDDVQNLIDKLDEKLLEDLSDDSYATYIDLLFEIKSKLK